MQLVLQVGHGQPVDDLGRGGGRSARPPSVIPGPTWAGSTAQAGIHHCAGPQGCPWAVNTLYSHTPRRGKKAGAGEGHRWGQGRRKGLRVLQCPSSPSPGNTGETWGQCPQWPDNPGPQCQCFGKYRAGRQSPPWVLKGSKQLVGMVGWTGMPGAALGGPEAEVPGVPPPVAVGSVEVLACRIPFQGHGLSDVAH